MKLSSLSLKNWRNFTSVNVQLQERVFIVGPNAAGKSNLLDALKFLRDICLPGGGLQKAVEDRGGVSKIRSLSARKYPNIELEIHITENNGGMHTWRYAIGIKQEQRGYRQPYLAYERVWRDDRMILDRPNEQDKTDVLLLTQTHLEQITANVDFRDISRFLDSISYLHLVPQLVRYPRAFSGPGIPGDPFGRGFLEQVAKTQSKVRTSRLRRIEGALRIAVPQLKELSFTKDEAGYPHLEAIYEHWRPIGARQREDQFSDGTLRLLGFLWALLEGDSLLLLEEPELSLNSAIVSRLAGLIYRLQRVRGRQIFISTHSADLLSDRGISGEEVILLTPTPEGTTVKVVSSMPEILELLKSGMSVGEAALPYTSPRNALQLELFK